MKSRCTNPNATGYRRYGGRGISVCERWHDFNNFFADMGVRPSPLHTLERINNDGNYEPANVRWALRHEQQDNRSLRVDLTIRGTTKPLTAWAREHGLKARVLRNRIAKGYPEKDWLAAKEHFERCPRPVAQPKLLLTKGTRTQTLIAWSEELGISRATLYDRMKRGMTDEEVLTIGRVKRRWWRK